MSPRSDREFQAPEEFRRTQRGRFLREAETLYGRRAPVALRLLGFAAAGLLAFALWWSTAGDGSAPAPSRDLSETSGEASATAAGNERVVEEHTRDGTRVIARAGARWEWTGPRSIWLISGQLFLDVEPTGEPFEIHHAQGRIKVLGTRLVVDGGEDHVRVGLGSGEASLENDAGSVQLSPGEEGVVEEGRAPFKQDARRFSHLAAFIADAIEEKRGDETRPGDEFASGLARIPGPGGATSRLDVVSYHLDVHVEDGMARTTIDQVFFNPSWNRVEGTFLFPLPPDASISRLAMYVNGELMEGGMAERSRAVEVYEGIVRKMKDPAILEWMEGSTFRLRIFPFEPRSERRIVLSYQQSLESLYEVDRYRFPLLQPAAPWQKFSVRVLVKGGAREGWKVSTPTYPLERVTASSGDLELAYEEKNARPAQDLLVEIRRPERPLFDYASQEQDGARMVCVTATPRVRGAIHRGPRRVLLVVDRSGGAAAVERQAQARLAEEILEALDREDRINVLAYATEPRAWGDDFRRRSRRNLARAVAFLEEEEFVGAGDLAAALRKARELFGEPREGDCIFYLGDGIDTLSGLEAERIAVIPPAEIPLIAIPVSRSFDRALLGALAARSGGRVVPLSPDDRIAWRAFDLVSALRTPAWREIDWELLDERGKPLPGTFHADRASLRDGESVRLVGRVEGAWPRTLRLGDERFDLPERRPGCGWIPRLWAKLRIESLERDSAAEHRQEIVRLGKEHYVMTPFTSLLVLENEAMYRQYGIDRGRRDHWALYSTPEKWIGRKRAPVTTVHAGNVVPPWTNGWLTDWYSANRQQRVYFLPQISHAGAIDYKVEHLFSVPLQTIDQNAQIFGERVFFGQEHYLSIFHGAPGRGGGHVLINASPVIGYAVALNHSGGIELNSARVNSFPRNPPGFIDGASRLTVYGLSFTDFLVADIRLGEPTGLGSVTFNLRDEANDVRLPFGDARSNLGLVLRSHRAESNRLETPVALDRLKALLPGGFDLAVSFGKRRALVFAGGERLVLDGERAVYLGPGKSAVHEPLFETTVAGGAAGLDEWSRLPWFLQPAEALAAGARIEERSEAERTTLTLDRGGLTVVELVFSSKRPVEMRVVLRGGLVLQRIVYDAWTDVKGCLLPTHGFFLGPDGQTLDEMHYRYDEPRPAERERLAELAKASGAQGIAKRGLGPWWLALVHYRRADRPALEAHLKAVEKQGLATTAVRKVARLAALRWGGNAVIEAPELDPQSPEVRRWLPPERVPLEKALERSLHAGDVAALATLAFSSDDPRTSIAHLERLRGEAPAGLHGVLDLWVGELAARKGWKLKAYEALSRASRWRPLEGSVALADRLSELALALNEPETALEHAERAHALDALDRRGQGAPPAKRFEKLSDIAARQPELWKARGRSILERWCRATPKEAQPFERLATF
ncbi:MAG: VIT domain-containing protein, partial [Planctomycetota bacterium]|nr:VIT domain-containing protein [Planctomycetota bacterium]